MSGFDREAFTNFVRKHFSNFDGQLIEVGRPAGHVEATIYVDETINAHDVASQMKATADTAGIRRRIEGEFNGMSYLIWLRDSERLVVSQLSKQLTLFFPENRILEGPVWLNRGAKTTDYVEVEIEVDAVCDVEQCAKDMNAEIHQFSGKATIVLTGRDRVSDEFEYKVRIRQLVC